MMARFDGNYRHIERRERSLTAALREQTEQSAKLDRNIWANLACLCVFARRQEDIGYGG